MRMADVFLNGRIAKAFLAGAGLLMVFSSGLHAEEPADADNAPFHVVQIDREACNQLANTSGNEAQYRSGVAADGSSVAPADLDGGYAINPRDFYYFNVEIQPLGGTGQFSPLTSLDVASVALDLKSGQVTIDGQDVGGADQALADACARQEDGLP